ncbi:MAG: hypothetical protein KGR26_01895 [Cyanobacteria bacterium REEB65]|nr:hypothetical protein [Cyanobacteria bacterium REEB65]
MVYTCHLCPCELDTPQQLANHLGRLHGIDQPDPNAPPSKVTAMTFASTGRLVDCTSGLEILCRDRSEALDLADRHGGRPQAVDGGFVIVGPPPQRIDAAKLPPGWTWEGVSPRAGQGG